MPDRTNIFICFTGFVVYDFRSEQAKFIFNILYVAVPVFLNFLFVSRFALQTQTVNNPR